MARFRLLRTAPWRRGPLLLARRPGVALALAAAAFVATTPLASVGPFLSAARSATLHRQFTRTCPAKVAEHVESTVAFRSLLTGTRPYAFARDSTDVGVRQARRAYATRQATLRADAGHIDGLTEPVTTLRAVVSQRPAGSTRPFPDNKFWLVGRSDDFASHLRVLRGPVGAGVWVPDSYAAEAGLHVGDVFETTTMELLPGWSASRVDPAAAPARLRVAAIYTDLRTLPDQPYWCTLLDTYRIEIGDRPVLPVVFADLGTFAGVAATSTYNAATEYVDLQLTDPRLTAARAAAIAGRIDAMRGRLQDSGATVSAFLRPTFISALAGNAHRAELVRATLAGTVVPAAVTGVLVGLSIVAAAAAFWVRRRRTELRVLAAHGVPPGALGVKALTEAAPALLLGACAGGAGSWLLVLAAGPSTVLSGEAYPLAAGAVAVVALACLAVTGAVATTATRGLADARQAGRSRVPRWWWAPLPLAVPPALWWWLGGARESADRLGGVGTVAHVPVRLVVVPIVAFVVLQALAAGLVVARLRRWPRRTRDTRAVRYLAGRRLRRAAAATALLAVATALPVALAVFAAAADDSTRLTLHAKAGMRLGADTVATLSRPSPVPAALSGRATEVLRLDGLRVDGYQVDVLGVDPATFPAGAYWNAQIAAPAPAELVRDLGTGPLPTALGYGVLPPGPHVISRAGRVVARVTVRGTGLLPGAQGGYPLLLVNRDVVRTLVPVADTQLWINGDSATARRALDRAHLPVTRVRTADDTVADTLFEPVTYTFGYLVAFALFIGCIATAGLLLYLEARIPGHARAFVLLRRMGVDRRRHLAVLCAEVGVPVAAGVLGGLLMAVGAVLASRGQFDLSPAAPPGPVLAAPVTALGVLAAAGTVIAVGAACAAHLRILRVPPGEALRGSD